MCALASESSVGEPSSTTSGGLPGGDGENTKGGSADADAPPPPPPPEGPLVWHRAAPLAATSRSRSRSLSGAP